MIQLPNNCRCSGIQGDPKKKTVDELPVFPKNWKTTKANAKLMWYIKYRFYDDNLNKSKQVVLKANQYPTLEEKRAVISGLMQLELRELKEKGLNKITNLYSVAQEEDISEFTPFTEALEYAFKKVRIVNMLTLKSCLKYIILAAKQKHYDKQPISAIRRRHIVLLFEQVEKIKIAQWEKLKKEGEKLKGEAWGPHNYNMYRSYLGILYNELEKLEIVPANLPYLLDKKDIPKKIRETLTQEERAKINEHLFNNHYPFWRCMQIFFHAGCREVELLAVKKQDIDLEHNRFKVLVKKGRGGHSEEWRTIKFIVQDLWQELYDMADKDMYIFHKGLVPATADKPIRREQLTRRWMRHVKKPLGVTADFYALKHANLDEIAKERGLKAAMSAAGHSSTSMTKVYAFGEEIREQEREHELLKQANNKFA